MPHALIPHGLMPHSLMPHALIPHDLIPNALMPHALMPHALWGVMVLPEWEAGVRAEDWAPCQHSVEILSPDLHTRYQKYKYLHLRSLSSSTCTVYSGSQTNQNKSSNWYLYSECDVRFHNVYWKKKIVSLGARYHFISMEPQS